MVGQVVQTGTTPVLVNVCDYGANGNRDTADPTANTKAIQAAFDAALAAPNAYSATVYFPPGQYLINGTIRPKGTALEGGLTILGSGRRSSFLLWTTDITALEFDCGDKKISSVTIKDFGFFCQMQVQVDEKVKPQILYYTDKAIAIDIKGKREGGFERALFQSLGFYGPMSTAIHSIDTDGDPDYIEGFAVRWSVFDDIDFDNGGQKGPPNRCVWFEHASGTGNIFSNFTGGGTASIIEIGDGTYTCGDMLIQGIQGGTGQDMIKLTGGQYMERVSILNCQADGDVKNGLNLKGMGQFEVRNFLWGGGTTWKLENCYDYVIEGSPGNDEQCMQSSNHRGYKWNDGPETVYSEEHQTYSGTVGGGSLFLISFPGYSRYRGNRICKPECRNLPDSEDCNQDPRCKPDSCFAVMIEIHANGTISLPDHGGTIPLVCKFTGVLSLNGGTASFFNPKYEGVPGVAFSVDTSSAPYRISVASIHGYGISGALGARIRSIGSPHWVDRYNWRLL